MFSADVFALATIVSLILTVSSNQSCPNNWIVYNGNCFYVGLHTKSWNQARIACESLGGSLLVVDNIEEWDDISAHAIRLVSTWIGIKAGPKNVSTWVTDSKLSVDGMPWLIKTADHGRVKTADCVSYFGTANPLQAYLTYANCDLELFYMCRKKGTQ